MLSPSVVVTYMSPSRKRAPIGCGTGSVASGSTLLETSGLSAPTIRVPCAPATAGAASATRASVSRVRRRTVIHDTPQAAASLGSRPAMRFFEYESRQILEREGIPVAGGG